MAYNGLRVYLVPNFKTENMEEEQRKRMKQKFADAGERSALNKHAVSGRSEQCLHTERVWTIDPYDQKCFKCVKCGKYGV